MSARVVGQFEMRGAKELAQRPIAEPLRQPIPQPWSREA